MALYIALRGCIWARNIIYLKACSLINPQVDACVIFKYGIPLRTEY